MFGVRELAMIGMGALVSSAFAGTAEQAEKIREEFRLQNEIVGLKAKAAKSPEEQQSAWKERPSPAVFAKRMWSVLLPSLSEEWILDNASWFFVVAQQAQQEADADTKVQLANACQALRVAIEKSHLKSPKLSAVCFGMIATNDSLSLPLLEKIDQSSPDPKVQGVAALARAILLRSLGETKDLLRQRLMLLRKAIVNSADVENQGISVAKLAEDELYMIRFLTKGQEAPELDGMDGDGKKLTLGQFSGKCIILIFWKDGGEVNRDLLGYANNLREKYQGKAVTILGVNGDKSDVLRNAISEKKIEWSNFSDPSGALANQYRVGVWPTVYVLDAQRKICYSGQMGAFVDLTLDAVLADGGRSVAPESAAPMPKTAVEQGPAKAGKPLLVKPPQ